MSNTKLVYNKKIRSVCNVRKQKWYYCLNDVVKALTNVKDAKSYLKDIRNRDEELAKKWKKLVISLEMDTPGGKQPVMCANAVGVVRIIQSLRSPNAELFKRWLEKINTKIQLSRNT